MMIFALMAPALLGLTELPQQRLTPGRCVTFLWTRTEAPVRLAMLDETAQTMRLRRGRQMFDIARQGADFYAGHGYRVTVTLDYGQGQQIQGGNIVESGAMRIEADEGDAVVVPVGGMRACQ
jgi:hypothetical protein